MKKIDPERSLLDHPLGLPGLQQFTRFPRILGIGNKFRLMSASRQSNSGLMRDMTKNKILLFTYAFLFVSTIAHPAYAYLDPGTGAIVVQLILGGVAGLMVIAKLYWLRVKDFFGGKETDLPSAGQEEK